MGGRSDCLHEASWEKASRVKDFESGLQVSAKKVIKFNILIHFLSFVFLHCSLLFVHSIRAKCPERRLERQWWQSKTEKRRKRCLGPIGRIRRIRRIRKN